MGPRQSKATESTGSLTKSTSALTSSTDQQRSLTFPSFPDPSKGIVGAATTTTTNDFDLPPDCPVGTWKGAAGSEEMEASPSGLTVSTSLTPTTSSPTTTSDVYPPLEPRITSVIHRGYSQNGEKMVNDYAKVKNLSEGTFGRVKLYRYVC